MPLIPGVAALSIAVTPAPARADGCEPPSGVSPCIDANSLWLAPGEAHFFSIAPARPLGNRRAAFGFGTSFLDRPVRLHAASPDPEGRFINVVRYALDSTLLLSIGVMPRLELNATLANLRVQSGSGVEGYTSQNGPPLSPTAVRDPRLGAGFSLIDDRRLGFAAKPRLEFSLPLGEQDKLAGEASFVAAPSLALELKRGRLLLGSEIGLRLREVSDFAGTRLGSQATIALGAGFDVLDRGLLAVLAEGWLMPSLASSDHDLPDGTKVRDVLLAPAEWQFSVRSELVESLALQLGGGTALPLSSERRIAPDGSSETEHFAGITAARFRVNLVVRYVPGKT